MQKIKNHQKIIQIDQVVFNSNFPSGNLFRAEQIVNGYNLWIGSDHPNNNYKTWFYFSITGVTLNTWVNFTIKNMSNQIKLLKQGFLPVYKTQKQKIWKRIKQAISPSSIISAEEGLEFTFRFFFDISQKIYFAFTYPWTLKDNHNLLLQLEQLAINKNQLFYSRTTLINSFQNRPIDLLTITTKRGIAEKAIIKNQNLFPTGNFPYLFNNKTGVLISARVHPGQVPSSHIMNGLLKYLISFKPQVRMLLDELVFYIIPIINPDGVQNGLYRSDSQGQNLNRCYTNPNQSLQPQIYGIKQFVSYMIKQKKIQSCIDLHAHAVKKGCFIYGNYIPQFNKQLQICLFAKLMSLNNKYFDYDACNFTQKNMYSKDKGDSLSKQGAARVAIFKDTNLHTCWTLQCNYNMSRFMNRITEKSNLTEKFNAGNLNKKIIMDYGNDDIINGSDIYDIQSFQSIGKSIAQSLNDFYQINPQYSRINSSEFKHMKVLKLHVSISILRMIPFRFENSIRKILLNLNSEDKIYENLIQLLLIIQKKDITKLPSSKLGASKYPNSVKQIGAQKKDKKKELVLSLNSKSIKCRGNSVGINKMKSQKQ